MEIAASTPIPGSTPTTLPISTPTKHQSRFVRLERDAEAEPEIGQGGGDHRDQPTTSGICTCSR